jgi:putative colanic acid biosynthesis glycosyltransferase WcaI
LISRADEGVEAAAEASGCLGGAALGAVQCPRALGPFSGVTLSVLIVTHETRRELEDCLASLEQERAALPLEVIVVDNASTDGTVAAVERRFPWVRVIPNAENAGFARAVNQALELANGESILILNPDTVVPGGTLQRALQRLGEEPDVGLLGCKLVRPDGSFDHACKRGFPTISAALYYFLGLNRLMPRSPRFARYTAGPLGPDDSGLVDAVNGAFMLVRREAVDEVGLLDERFWLYAEDLDWCRRFWKGGWKILYWPEVEVLHIKGASGGEHRSLKLNFAFHRSIWLFYAKHHAPTRSRLITTLVFFAIWIKFAFSVMGNLIRSNIPSPAGRRARRIGPGAGHRPRRIVIHDYAGHPFQVHLSRELSRRGYDVLHLHCPSYHSGKGALEKRPDDPDSLAIEGVLLREPFRKYSSVKRPQQEREYAQLLVRRIDAFDPDLVLSSNTPLLSQWRLISHCQRRGIRFVFWQQDINSIAITRALRSRLPFVGGPISRAFVALERRLVRRSDAIVVISEDFEPTLHAWGVAPSRIQVVHNWAPVEELPVRPRDNAWARRHDLVDKRVALYSGTLGLKHNPQLLLALAAAFRAEPDVRVVVVSEGEAADWLRRQAREQGLEQLLVLPFQPYSELPDVLASGDVLVVLLEADAAVFSVPSKVLSYHCARRALLAAVPEGNLAARTIKRARSGIVVDPRNVEELVDATRRLLADPEQREAMAARARNYADANFDIGLIADRFEGMVDQLCPAGNAARAQV